MRCSQQDDHATPSQAIAWFLDLRQPRRSWSSSQIGVGELLLQKRRSQVALPRGAVWARHVPIQIITSSRSRHGGWHGQTRRANTCNHRQSFGRSDHWWVVDVSLTVHAVWLVEVPRYVCTCEERRASSPKHKNRCESTSIIARDEKSTIECKTQ